MKKRLLSFALVIAMICTMLPQISTRVNAASTYSINGVSVHYTDYASSPNECWVYANNFYKKIWGVNFSNSFSESSNSLRNLADTDLTLTADHLKTYVSNAALGSCLRICNSEYLHGTDGWGHSQIIVQKDSNGFTVFEGGLSASPYCREKYYTWSEYINTGWLGGTYAYIKYIKWPAAPAYSKCSHNYNNLGICTSTCKSEYNWQATYDTSCAGIYKVSLSGGIYLRTDKPYSASTAKSELIKAGTEVQVLGSVLNAVGKENHLWYKVSYNGVIGYTSEDNLTLVPHTCDKGTYMYYEEVHPHRSCYKCSICGKIWAEAGSTNKMPSCQQCAASSEHTCNKGTYMYYEEVHPHRSCYKCSICGKIWAADNTTNYMSSCLECQKPGKPVLTNLSGKTFQDNESVTFTWAATSNTTHYNLYMQHKNSSGQWEKYDQLFYVSSGLKLTFPANEYRCYIQSYNSNYWAADGSDWLYTEGDFTYFTVAPADHLPTAVCDEVTGKENSVYVRGWAFDSDTPSKSLEIHVYIDGAFVGAGTANGSRPDVNNVYGCGNNHGFSFTVSYKVSTTGNHSVEVYALNTASGKNHRLMGPFNVTVTAHTHAYTSKVTTAATCTTNGVRTYTCSGCSGSYTESISATGHSYGSWVTTVAASCTTAGTKRKICSSCGDEQTQTITARGHILDIHSVKPTCSKDGFDGYVCINCDYTEIVAILPATGEHMWDAWTTVVEANCKQEGAQRRECGTCGQTQGQTLPVAEHDYGQWQTVVESTCTATGQRKHVCNVCGETQTEEVVAKGHRYISMTVEPRCESQGYTQYGCYYCYDYYEDTYVPALGHQYENGYCTRCDAKDPNHIEDSNNCISGLITSFGDDSAPVMIVLYSDEIVVKTITSTDGTYSLGAVATGTYVVEISKQNHVTRTYEVIVTDTNIELDVKIHLLGDINGDGHLNTRDVNRANAHAKKTSTLTGYELICADINADGRVNTRDVNRMNAHAAKTKLLW